MSESKVSDPVQPGDSQEHDAHGFAPKLRLIGRIMGIAMLALLFLMLVVDAIALAVDQGFYTSADALLFGVLPVLLGIAAFVAAWRFPRSGAIGVIGSYLLLCLAPSFRAAYVGKGFTFFADMWLYALPLLASGVLLLVATYTGDSSKGQTTPG